MTEAKNLQEANALLTAQAAEIAKLREQSSTVAKLNERVLLSEATTFVSEKLGSVDLPAVTKNRLKAELVNRMPLKEGGALDTAAYETLITAAVKEAAAEIQLITRSGEIRGMGASTPEPLDEAKVNESLTGAFGRLGLNESAAKRAAKGR